MIKSLIFYLDNWGSRCVIYRADGPNLVIPNIDEMVIFYYKQIPRHFVVKERILDYADNVAHLKVELVNSINIEDLGW